MKRKHITVPVTEELDRKIRVAAAERGMSKAGLVRDLLKQFLERESNTRTQGDENG